MLLKSNFYFLFFIIDFILFLYFLGRVTFRVIIASHLQMYSLINEVCARFLLLESCNMDVAC